MADYNVLRNVIIVKDNKTVRKFKEHTVESVTKTDANRWNKNASAPFLEELVVEEIEVVEEGEA